MKLLGGVRYCHVIWKNVVHHVSPMKQLNHNFFSQRLFCGGYEKVVVHFERIKCQSRLCSTSVDPYFVACQFMLVCLALRSEQMVWRHDDSSCLF